MMQGWLRSALCGMMIIAALSGCAAFQPLTPTDQTREAERVVGYLQGGNFNAFAALIDPVTAKPEFAEQYRTQVMPYVAGHPQRVEIASWSHFERDEGTYDDVVLQYRYPTQWMIVDVALVERSGGMFVLGVHAQKMASSLQEQNAFLHPGITPLEWLFALVDLVLFVFTIGTFVVALRTRIARFKWLWCLFALFGIMMIKLDWTNGATVWTPLSVQLIGESASRIAPIGPVAHSTIAYQPWMLQLTFPLGAIVFWCVRGRLATRRPPRQPMPQLSDDPSRIFNPPAPASGDALSPDVGA